MPGIRRYHRGFQTHFEENAGNTGTATTKQNAPADFSIELSSVECGKNQEQSVGALRNKKTPAA